MGGPSVGRERLGSASPWHQGCARAALRADNGRLLWTCKKHEGPVNNVLKLELSGAEADAGLTKSKKSRTSRKNGGKAMVSAILSSSDDGSVRAIKFDHSMKDKEAEYSHWWSTNEANTTLPKPLGEPITCMVLAAGCP